MTRENIRNFCIIAHIDHGKSTLADRFLELTGTVDARHLKAQTLDSMELERERGITIKLKTVRMNYVVLGESYQLNLIDTPGHVDFSYEVSRSLAACEGALLVVDATQGIQAQTVSHVYKAMDAGLTIIPAINKIDLSAADSEKVADDLVKTFGFDRAGIARVSAKTGAFTKELLAEIVRGVPAPGGDPSGPLRALVFDTFYDEHQGVVAIVKVVDGELTSGMLRQEKLLMMATGVESVPEEFGIMTPHRKPVESLSAGEVGYMVLGLKDVRAVRVGDTITLAARSAASPLPGYKEIKPFVFVSLYPIENDAFSSLREALSKLALSDAALMYEPEKNSALGFGFRCGFLGLLHADVVQERLEREYNLSLLATTPTVEYRVKLTDGTTQSIRSPGDFPDPTRIVEINEPWILLDIVSPSKYVGAIINRCEARRAVKRKLEYPTLDRAVFQYELPLSELIHNFFDELKTVSSGYASLEYDLLDFRPVRAVRLDVLIHGNPVPPLAQIIVKDDADKIGRALLIRLKDVIPRQQFQVTLQAAVGGRIIAREDIPAFRKDVTAKLYGGHRDRKDKLLEIQRKGKKRMKRFGKVDIPQEAFRQVLAK